MVKVSHQSQNMEEKYVNFVTFFPDPCDRVLIRLPIVYSMFFTSPLYPAFYPNNQHCSWRFEIRNGDGNFVVRIFNSNIAEFDDFLYIGRGEETIASNLVARVRSFTFPNQIVISGPRMWILFLTNDIGTQRGFFLQVEVNERTGRRL